MQTGKRPKLRVLVCGSRDWIEIVIDGVARGADTLGNICAKRLELPYRRFPANWDLYGKAAGAIRNRQMLTEGRPNLVLAFHKNLQESKGTKDMVTIALRAGIPVVVYPPQPLPEVKRKAV